MSYNQDPSLLNELAQLQGADPAGPFLTTAPATAGQIFSVQHGLGRLPRGWVVIYKSAACDVYDAGLKWDAQYIYLKATAANTILQLLIY